MEFDMFELFSADHRRLSDLLVGESFEPVVIRELSMHLAAETRLLYPAIERYLDGGDDISTQLRHDDHQLEEQLSTLPSDDPSAANIDRLRSMVEHHIDAQEAVFPEAKQWIPDHELDRLGQEVSRTIREAPTHPHPHLPDHGVFEPAADAIASTIDHLRDLGHRDDQ
jgi:hypothetical protein